VRKRVGLAVASSLYICVATTGCSIQHRPKLQYSGQLTSTSSSCPKTRGTLIIQRDDVVFAPDDGTWTLDGKVSGSAVSASNSRPSFDHKTFATELKGTMTDKQVLGTYSTPSCTYTVDLTRF
jgi:hypothetical protein